MFSGSWKENAQEVTVIEIADKHITEDGKIYKTSKGT